MATIICGWCGDRCHMTPLSDAVAQAAPVGGTPQWIVDRAYTCDGCGRASVVAWRTSHDPTDQWISDYGHDGGPQSYENARWHPLPGHNREFPDVPEAIASAAAEAWLCQTAGATRGACVLARSVVEATAKNQGFESGNLMSKIEALADAGMIRPAVRDQAHEIRLVGNDVAHGDLGVIIATEESAEVLELMGEVLNEVYQAPARRDRLRAQREARTNPHQGT